MYKDSVNLSLASLPEKEFRPGRNSFWGLQVGMASLMDTLPIKGGRLFYPI